MRVEGGGWRVRVEGGGWRVEGGTVFLWDTQSMHLL